MNEYHAHTVLEWIAAAPEGQSINSIVNWAHETHGKLATYHTCRFRGLTIQQLIAFFLDKQKVQPANGLLVFNPERACAHH